jgi:hypothetical protein
MVNDWLTMRQRASTRCRRRRRNSDIPDRRFARAADGRMGGALVGGCSMLTHINHNAAVEFSGRCSANPRGRMHLMSAIGRVAALLLGVFAMLTAAPLRAQDLDSGKSGARLFATNCAMCHRTPGGLATRTNRISLFYFLRQHYTSSQASAIELVGYLLAASSTPARAKRKSTTAAEQQPTASPSRAPSTAGAGRRATRKRSTIGPGQSAAPPRPSSDVPSR